MKQLRKKENKVIVMISLIVIIISSFLLIKELIKNNKIEEDNNIKIEEYFNEEIKEEIIEQPKKENKKQNYENYIGILEINKISLKRGFYNINSKLNNVNRNIQVLEKSDMPDVENGNLIIASHSGNSSVSFFKTLPKLNIGDVATVYYEENVYNYELKEIYEIDKIGTANLHISKNKKNLILITCKHGTKKQYVFNFELNNKE